MFIIPFGDIEEERFELSKRYNLIEQVNDVWRLTNKCKNNYEELSYFKYLKGEREKPDRLTKESRDTVIEGLLDM